MKDLLIKFLEWKKDIYWVRGVKIFLVLFVCFLSLQIIPGIFGLAFLFLWIPFLFLSDLFGIREIIANHREPIPGPNALGWIAFLIFCFAISVFLGWLYGKIKNRKKPPLNT